jgi:NSS family neurotransmitter:Na+ symporter
MGRLVGVAFFITLTVASITSTVSLLEVVASVGIDEFRLSRRQATLIAGSLAAFVGLFAALSPGILSVLDKVAGELFVIVGVVGMAVFFGWRLKDAANELAAGATGMTARSLPIIMFLIRYVIPPLMALLALVALRDTIRTLFG